MKNPEKHEFIFCVHGWLFEFAKVDVQEVNLEIESGHLRKMEYRKLAQNLCV